jgi:hypothetical protein
VHVTTFNETPKLTRKVIVEDKVAKKHKVIEAALIHAQNALEEGKSVKMELNLMSVVNWDYGPEENANYAITLEISER